MQIMWVISIPYTMDVFSTIVNIIVFLLLVSLILTVAFRRPLSQTNMQYITLSFFIVIFSIVMIKFAWTADSVFSIVAMLVCLVLVGYLVNFLYIYADRTIGKSASVHTPTSRLSPASITATMRVQNTPTRTTQRMI